MLKLGTISCINLIKTKNVLILLNSNNFNIRSSLQKFYTNKLGANNIIEKINIKKISDTSKSINKTKIFSPKISLIIDKSENTIITIEEAENIAKRKHLRLIKVSDYDNQTKRATYRLASETDLMYEDSNESNNKNASKKGTFKGDKLLSLNVRISDHDLSSRIKNTVKWLQKNYEVRVLISGSNTNENNDIINKIINKIESNISNYGKIVQKSNKGDNMKFKITPTINNSNANSDVKSA